MLIRTGTVARVEFQSELSGQLVALVDPAAIIYRGVIATSLVAAIANPSVGIYYASFSVPVDWQNYDFVSCQLTGSINGMAIARIKAVGVVLNVALTSDVTGSFTNIDQARLIKLTKAMGLELGISASQLDPDTGVLGYLRTSDNAINQSITKNPDGSITIQIAP